MRAPTVSVLTNVAARSSKCSPQRGRGGGMTQTFGWACRSHARAAEVGEVVSDIRCWAVSGLSRYYLQRPARPKVRSEGSRCRGAAYVRHSRLQFEIRVQWV